MCDNFETLQICTAYQLEDNIIKQMPFRLNDVNYQRFWKNFKDGTMKSIKI